MSRLSEQYANYIAWRLALPRFYPTPAEVEAWRMQRLQELAS